MILKCWKIFSEENISEYAPAKPEEIEWVEVEPIVTDKELNPVPDPKVGPVIEVPSEASNPEKYKKKVASRLTPFDAFELFFPSSLYDYILAQTLLYVKQ